MCKLLYETPYYVCLIACIRFAFTAYIKWRSSNSCLDRFGYPQDDSSAFIIGISAQLYTCTSLVHKLLPHSMLRGSLTMISLSLITLSVLASLFNSHNTTSPVRFGPWTRLCGPFCSVADIDQDSNVDMDCSGTL